AESTKTREPKNKMSLNIDYGNTAHTLQEYPLHFTGVSSTRYNIGDQPLCRLIRISYIFNIYP
ncbi:hypothetical protein O5190_27055, partial [Escherichia coli]|nr:hypothetical protein [Escherichia coli]